MTYLTYPTNIKPMSQTQLAALENVVRVFGAAEADSYVEDGRPESHIFAAILDLTDYLEKEVGVPIGWSEPYRCPDSRGDQHVASHEHV